MSKIIEFKLEKLQELAENCGCADLAIIDPYDGSYEEELEFDTDEWVEGDGIEVDDEFGEFNGNYDEDLADVIDFPDADDDRGLLKKKIMQAISDVLGETANSDKLHGGKADYVPDYKFNKKELRKGIRHELEHSDDSDIAKETAEDHMMEDPKYYTHLQKHMGQFEKKGKKKIKEQQAVLNAEQQGYTWARLKQEMDAILNKARQENRGNLSTAVLKKTAEELKSQGKGVLASIVATGAVSGIATVATAGAAGAIGGAAGGLVIAGFAIYSVFKAIKDHKQQALSSEEVRNVVAMCGMDYNLSQVVDDKLEEEFFEKILKPYIDQKIRTAPNERISDISILFSDWINKKTDPNGLAGSQHKITPPGQPTTAR